MFKITEIIDGYRLEKRINTYTALIKKDSTQETAFIANTGRMTELLIKDVPVFIKRADNPKRKTLYDLMAVSRDVTIVCIDSRVPNWIFEYQLKNNKLKELDGFEIKKREFKIGNSKIDYLLHSIKEKCLVELKLCTLVNDKEMLFPDAVSQRSTKHLLDLINADRQGYRTIVIFLGLRGDPMSFKPNEKLDPKFKEAVDKALEAGVEIISLKTEIQYEKAELIFSDLKNIPMKK
ncbi:MAG TPA: DNA/RNA nuclease SfsA [Candidatus Deferrimicrobium sp.]|nr:DNA/RNA nuclease SfsA [Candidatus Deferrimicrobium sp.]